MRILLLLGLLTIGESVTCDQIRNIYSENTCCGAAPGENAPCLRQIPECSTTTNGYVCFDGSDVVVKGLREAMQFTDTHITVSRHIIFGNTNTYDIGSAESKVRDLYVSENSLWIGDNNKIDIEGGKMKFRKRKTDKVPESLNGMIVPQDKLNNPGNVLPHEWLEILRQNVAGAEMQDLYSGNNADYDTDVLDLLEVRTVGGVQSLEITGHIVFPTDRTYDIGEADKMVKNIHWHHSRIIVNGNNIEIVYDTVYVEEGASCYDVDGTDISSTVEVSGDTVSTAFGYIGESPFVINYNCPSINKQATRTVTIVMQGSGGGGGSNGGGLRL